MWFFRFLRAAIFNFFQSFAKSPETGILGAVEQQEMERVLQKTGLDPENIHQALNRIVARSKRRTDINDLLPVIFFHAAMSKPALIVELGVRGGESTFVLERVAACCSSTLVSADINDCSRASKYPKWKFVKGDDIKFAKDFPAWCKSEGLDREIDVLFIDTSHLYEHTAAEIKSWFPLLSEKAVVIFHDTNLGPFFLRRDGSMGVGWNNHRGVIRAIEEHFNTHFDETRDFSAKSGGFQITHYSHCNGLTVLQK